jgi:polyferredoxin
MLMTGELHLPVPALIAAGPVYRGEGFFMLALYGSSLLLLGPAWCSHLCYIGAWDHWASKSRKSTPTLPAHARYTRLGLLALVLAAALVLRFSGFPTLIAVWAAAVFGLVGVMIMLTLSTRCGTMVHCTAYCPIGIVSNVMGKVNPWRVRIAEGCSNCGKCSRACRFSALSAADLERGRPGLSCTLCGDCIASCPDSRLHYTFPGLSPSTARKAFIVAAVALHAVFLGVARI